MSQTQSLIICLMWKNILQTSSLNKKHYYPVRPTTYLRILLETRRGNGHCKVSFNIALILKLILNTFKSALTNLPCISNLSANAVFYSLSSFYRNFLNFEDMKNNFKYFIRKKLKYKQFKQDWKNEGDLYNGQSRLGEVH